MGKSFEFQVSKAGGFGNVGGLMSANTKKSMAAMAALIILGVLVLVAGETSLVVLVPAAALVWHAVSPKLPTGRN